MTKYKPKTADNKIKDAGYEDIRDFTEDTGYDASRDNTGDIEYEDSLDYADDTGYNDTGEHENIIDEDHDDAAPAEASDDGDAADTVRKKHKKWPIVLAIVLGSLIVVIAGLLVAVHIVTGGFKRTELNKEDLGIVETTTAQKDEGEEVKKITKITNIAFFGIDTRDFLPEIGDQNKSDSIIIMSINPINNTIKMTSILRDSKVPVEGYGAVKINMAYQKGGPALAINTLNTNFQLDIEDYVTVDFGELADAIDIVGGVDIEITAEEADLVNYYATDEMHYYDSYVSEGWNHMNGAQAVSYARIRKLDTDVFRASRQQTVLTALFNNLKATPKSEYPALITQLLGCVETSLSYVDIISIISSIDVSSAELIKNTVPDINYQAYVWGGYDESIDAWVWIYDLDDATNRIHTIIYGTEGNGEGETEVETVDPDTSDITY